MDDHSRDQGSGERHACNSQATSTKKKGRGSSKGVQTTTPMFLEFDDTNLPTGQWEAAYGKQIGTCAKKIDINVKEYLKMDKVDKQNLWEEMKLMFHINDPEGVKEKNFHMAVGARFRRFKSWLNSRFITKTEVPPVDSLNAQLKPWELYEGYITEDQWKEFEAYYTSEEFKAKSEKGKESAKQNKYRHHLGQRSYGRAREVWGKTNRIPTPTESSTTSDAELSSSTAVSERVKNRPLDWVLARQILLPDGSWGIDPKDVETVQIANSVLENLKKKVVVRQEGTNSHEEWGIDALTMALGKKDHRGHVKGLGRCGIGVSHSQAFGKQEWKGKRLSQCGCSLDDLEAVKASLTKVFEARLEEKLSQRVAEEVHAYLTSMIPQITTNPKLPIINELGAPLPKNSVKGKAPCVIECTPPPSKKAKSRESKAKVDSCSVKSGHSSIKGIEDNIVHSFSECCELLYWCMASEDGKYDTTTVPLKAPLFYQGEDKEIRVTAGDVSEFLRGELANVSLIHVYILYIVQDYISKFQMSEITFLCPQKISAAEIKKDYLEVLGYIKKAFMCELNKESKHCKFIMAPYLEGNHWVLLVIDLKLGLLFEFDPATQHKEKARKLRVADVMMKAYKVYLSNLKGNVLRSRRKDLLFKQMECAQQPDGTECGYYVMRYMYEVVSAHNECKGNLEEEYCARRTAYNDKEMNEIREQWADYFRRKHLLKERI